MTTPADLAARHDRARRGVVWTTTTPEDSTVTDPATRTCLGCREPFEDVDLNRALCQVCRRKPFDALVARSTPTHNHPGYTTDRRGHLVVDSAEQRADYRGPNR